MSELKDEVPGLNFDSEINKLICNILLTNNWLEEKLKSFFAGFGVTYQQYNVLKILAQDATKPLNPAQIKLMMVDKNPDVTRLCDRLEAKGMIVRKTNAMNKRQILVSLSVEGLKIYTDMRPKVNAYTLSLPACSPMECKAISDGIDKVRG